MVNNKNNKNKYQKTDIRDYSSSVGKIPPQSIDLEKAVLGALLIQSDAFDTVTDILKPESFYEPIHQEIYRSIQNLGINQKPIDIITVAHNLKTEDKLEITGGEIYLAELTDKVATSAHLEFHAKLVHQKYIQRELIRASADIQQKSFDESEDLDELINFAENEIFQISEGNIKGETVQINKLVKQAVDQIYEAKEKNSIAGIPTGFDNLDKMTLGWQPSDLVIIAARPAMGKTAFVLSMARNIAVDYNKPIAFFSLEMSSIQLVNRLISAELEIPSEDVRTGNLTEYQFAELESRINKLEKAQIYIDDTPAISIFEFRAKCRRLKKQYNIQAVIIDYLQLMTAGIDMKGIREQEVSHISRNLKAIAKELNIPVIALSQLNRSVESRSGDKRPQLSDLRESGAIEQDADMVLFIHRPEYYNMDQFSDGTPTKGLAEIIIAKYRNGSTGSIILKFKKEFAKFTNNIVLYEEVAELGVKKFESSMNKSRSKKSNDTSISANEDFLNNTSDNDIF